MMPVYTNGKLNELVWETQALAELDQDPPVIDTWYTVLPETENVRLIYLAVRRLDDDAVAKDVTLNVIVDGISCSNTVAQNDTAWYYWRMYHLGDVLVNSLTASNVFFYEDLRGHTVLVRVRQRNDAIGANAELDGRVTYEVLKNTT